MSGQAGAGGFLRDAVLDVVVPEATEVDLGSFLGGPNQSGQDDKLFLPTDFSQRKYLFMDEIVNVHVIMKTFAKDEALFRSQNSELKVLLETYVIGAEQAASGEESKQPTQIKDMIDSSTIEDDHDRLVAVGDPPDPNRPNERFICVSWTTKVHITRSKINSSTPSIYFSASITTFSSKTSNLPQPSTSTATDEYLPSGEPGSINLLGAYSRNPPFATSTNPPYLTAARLAKAIPLSLPRDEPVRLLRNTKPRTYRLVPAVLSRVRIHPIGASPSTAKVLAAVAIDISPHVRGIVQLHTLNVTLPNGHAAPLSPASILTFPLRCDPGTSLSYAFDLQPSQPPVQSTSSSPPCTHTLTVELTATLSRGSSPALPIQTTWYTPVNLSSLTQPNSLTNLPPHPSLTTSSTPQPKPLQNLITLTLTGPATVPIGSPFRWTVLLANRSATRTLRLALLPLTSASSLSSTSTSIPAITKPRNTLNPILPTSLFATGAEQAPARAGTASLVALTPDVRLGPLPPGTSATGELKFLALEAGVGGVVAVRVVDLDGEGEGKVEGGDGGEGIRWVDVRGEMLPDVVAVELESDEEAGGTVQGA